MNLLAFSSRSITGVKIRTSGVRRLHGRDALRRRDDADEPDVARPGRVQSSQIAATALPPVASIGSTMSAVLDDRSGGSFA